MHIKHGYRFWFWATQSLVACALYAGFAAYWVPTGHVWSFWRFFAADLALALLLASSVASLAVVILGAGLGQKNRLIIPQALTGVSIMTVGSYMFEHLQIQLSPEHTRSMLWLAMIGTALNAAFCLAPAISWQRVRA